MAVYTLQDKRLRATRRADSLHRFLTLELSPGFLRTHFAGAELARLKPEIRRFVESDGRAVPFLEIRELPASLLAARVQFLEPPVTAPGAPHLVSGPGVGNPRADHLSR